jgi:hypothetical protein
MKKHRLIFSAALAMLLLGITTPQFAQDPSQDSQNTEKKEQEMRRRAQLLGMLRTINTAEVSERSIYGSYASWETLLAHQSEYLNDWRARFHPENPKFADVPEILPGCSLRLFVHADGQGYDVRLQDTAETKLGYTAFSDESGVIWEGGPLH